MIKITLTLALLFGLVTTASAEWTLTAVGGGVYKEVKVYTDTATRKKSGNTVKVWELTDYVMDEGLLKAYPKAKSFKSYMEYDCKEEKVRILTDTIFSSRMGEGRIIGTDYFVHTWNFIPPQTILKANLDANCGNL